MRRSRPHSLSLLFTLIAFFGLSGCDKGLKAPEKLAAATEQEAITYGKAIEAALNRCDKAVLNTLVDVKAIANKVVQLSKIPKSAQKDVYQGMLSEIENGFLSELCAKEEVNSQSHFLRTRKRDGHTTVLIRYSSYEGLNYIEFYVGKNKAGTILADNYFSYLTGDTLVNILRAPLDAFLNTDRSNIDAINNAMKALESNPAQGIVSIKSLPAELRNTKIMQISIILAASELGDATYQNAIADYRKLFPNDLSIDLVSIDGFIIVKNYKAAIAATNRLEKSIGGDPFLGQLRANILIEEGSDFQEAIRQIQTAIDAEPNWEDHYPILLLAQLGADDISRAVATMKHLSENFDGYDFTEESLVEFVEAPEKVIASEAWKSWKGTEKK